MEYLPESHSVRVTNVNEQDFLEKFTGTLYSLLSSGQNLLLACADCESPFLSVFDQNLSMLKEYDLNP